MNLNTLKTICQLRGISQAELARMAGVSRQAVSAWFRERKDRAGQINLHSKHLETLARGLGIKIDDLAEPLPVLHDARESRLLETALLWDRSHPDLSSFAAAVARRKDRALARLVEAFGLFQAAKIAGKIVWRRFGSYKKFIHPASRRVSETIWESQEKLGLI